jgi:PAS domain-containing protein
VRHVLVLREVAAEETAAEAEGRIPSWVKDYALFLLDVEGRIVAWYSGAERIFGFTGEQAIGQHVSFLYPSDDAVRFQCKGADEIGTEGHFG